MILPTLTLDECLFQPQIRLQPNITRGIHVNVRFQQVRIGTIIHGSDQYRIIVVVMGHYWMW